MPLSFRTQNEPPILCNEKSLQSASLVHGEKSQTARMAAKIVSMMRFCQRYGRKEKSISEDVT